MPPRILVIGGGHAAAQLCASLAQAGRGEVTLASAEPVLPYHRPPLSKTFPGAGAIAPAEIRPCSFYESNGVELLLSHRALRIDLSARKVLFESGGARLERSYDELVLATGAAAREVAALPRGTPGVHYLRSIEDARHLVAAVNSPGVRRVAVVGGGFIGLEVGSALANRGLSLTLLEAGPRLLERAASPRLSAWLMEAHAAAGLDVRLSSPLLHAHALPDGSLELQTPSGAVVADLVVVGAGSTPCTALAREAGLTCTAAGIEVDAYLRTTDARVSAIGDCTSFPLGPGGTRIRLESVYNANEQAKALASRLCGRPMAYRPSPWFWSDQGSLRLQIAGLYRSGLRTEVTGAGPGTIALRHFDGDELVAAETVNAPREHMLARRRIEAASEHSG